MMIIYLQSTDYNSWEAIVNGPHIRTTIINGKTVEKPPKDWDEHDMKKLFIGAKAVNTLVFFFTKSWGL